MRLFIKEYWKEQWHWLLRVRPLGLNPRTNNKEDDLMR
jgi:hypothetical protein